MVCELARLTDEVLRRMAGYETNLASEFYVLSSLHRLGVDATLTLGNKKSVDLFVVRKTGETVTVDVKGVANKYDWPADNIRATANQQHFIALVSYEGRFRDPTSPPNVWIMPYGEIEKFTKQYNGRKNISRALIIKRGSAYRDAWSLILGEEDTFNSVT